MVEQGALIEGQDELDKRIVAPEVAKYLRQAGEGEVVRDADAQPPARPLTGEVGVSLIAGGQDVARESGHRLAVGCQRDRMGVPQHERPADALLETANVLADGRLLDAEPGGGAGETASLLDGQEGRQKLRIVTSHHET